MRLLWVSLVLGALIVNTACGGGGGAATQSTQSGSLSGNWQISLERQVPQQPLIYTGFLLQSGDSLAGNLLFFFPIGPNSPLLPSCAGVESIAGTVDSSNISLTIDESGEDVSLQGTPSPMGGQFSNLAGGCTAFANSGTWSAFQVAPFAGAFHGTFTSTNGNGTVNVSGTLKQGPNTGADTATLSGTIATAGSPSFCSYLSSASVTGLVSGTTVALNLYGPNGSEITQIGQVGIINTIPPGVCPAPGGPNSPPPTACLLVTPDATSLTGNYFFPSISSSCLGDQGTVQLTFP